MATPALLPSPTFCPYRDSTPTGHRWMRKFIGSLFVVEGHIGSGKSTLGAMLTHYAHEAGLRAIFMPERFPEALLNQFIEWQDAHPAAAAHVSTADRNPYAFAFQMAMLDERQRTYLQAIDYAEKGYVVIIDRSLPGDYVFAAANRDSFTAEEWTQYEEKMHATDLLAPTAIVYLDASVDDCLRRIGIRARGAENKYSRTYMDRVDTMYRHVLAGLPYPIVTLPWGRDRRVQDSDERHAMSRAVFQSLEQLLCADRDGAPVATMRMTVLV